MSKAVLISINPKWVELILNGKKTIEVRKTAPKMETPFKVYVYCTYGNEKENYMLGKTGKVVAEFTCDSLLTIDCDSVAPFCKEWDRYVEKETGLTASELCHYSSRICSGWHISDLKVYDQPKELSEYKRKLRCCHYPCSKEYQGKRNACNFFNKNCEEIISVDRPPQSWQYVEEI